MSGILFVVFGILGAIVLVVLPFWILFGKAPASMIDILSQSFRWTSFVWAGIAVLAASFPPVTFPDGSTVGGDVSTRMAWVAVGLVGFIPLYGLHCLCNRARRTGRNT